VILGGRRLASLVVDDRQTFVRKSVDAIDAPVHGYTCQSGLPCRLGGKRPPSSRLVLPLSRRNPVDGLQKPRRPERAQHRMDRLVL
jgi:hypothetical protein